MFRLLFTSLGIFQTERTVVSTDKLTKTQKELLDSYIGHEGNYLEAIKENKDIVLQTKIFYLERAIDLSAEEFLEKLKELYPEEKESTIDLKRSFKFINDLYHNNEIMYGDFGTRKAVDHFFKGCGEVDLPALQSTIKVMITSEIDSMRKAETDIQQIAPYLFFRESESPPCAFHGVLGHHHYKLGAQEYCEIMPSYMKYHLSGERHPLQSYWPVI